MIHKILLGQSFCASEHDLTFFEKDLPLKLKKNLEKTEKLVMIQMMILKLSKLLTKNMIKI